MDQIKTQIETTDDIQEGEPREVGPWIPAYAALATLVFGLILFFGIGSALKTTPISASPSAKIDYPLCADSENRQFAPGITKIEVKIRSECWSGWITTPATWPKYYYQSVLNKGMEIRFLDSTRMWLPANDVQWFNRRGIFRLRGEGTAIVSIEK